MSDKENDEVKEGEEVAVTPDEGSAIAEKNEEFDPSKFTDDDKMEAEDPTAISKKEDTKSEDDKDSETAEDQNADTEQEAEEQGESTDYQTIEEEAETTEEDQQEEAEGETETEGEEADEVEGWQAVAEDLGIDVDNYQDFKNILSNQKELAVAGQTNEKINNMKGFLELGDEALMREEFKAKGYNEEDVEDEIDIMIENGTIRSKARGVRKDIEAVIGREQQALTVEPSTSETMSQEDIDASNRELKEYLSKTEKFYGGKASDKQKDGHYEYIQSGKFFDEITENAESVAKAAWLWRYKDQILKAETTKAIEKGKSSILDNMTNPEGQRSNQLPSPDTGEFNSGKFIESDQM